MTILRKSGGKKVSIYIQNFKKFRPLLGELIARDIKTKYRKSVLGVLWTLLNPLFMMIILSVVFSNLFKFDVEYFPVYLLSGQLIFNFYSEATTASMSAIMDNGKKYMYRNICLYYLEYFQVQLTCWHHLQL